MNEHRKDRTMTVTGQGYVTAAPNMAVIRLGVETTGENLTAIQSENARISQSIIDALQQMGINDIKTFQYSINKNYEYEDGRRIDRGYTVRNILEIRTGNLNQIGTIIDRAVGLGANVVESISFEVSNPDYYYIQALNLAMNNAIVKAKSLSMNLGVKAEPIPIRIVENSVFSTPPQPFQRELAVTTPIMPGNIRIEAFVTVEFTY